MRSRSYAFGILAVIASLAFAATASAEPKTHDGFMLQLELGSGYASLPGTFEEGGRSDDVDISGMAGIGGTLVGGTPADGLVIGGASLGHLIYSPRVELDGHEVEEGDDDNLSLTLMGPFVQYYPDPSSGLNLRLVLGYALAMATDDDLDDAAHGFGFSASVGYGWWIGEEWSLGVAGRFTYANVKYDSGASDLGDEVQKHQAYVPGVVLSLTYQ